MVTDKVWLVVVASILSDGMGLPEVIYVPEDEVAKAYEEAVTEYGFIRYSYECELIGAVAEITGVPLLEVKEDGK